MFTVDDVMCSVFRHCWRKDFYSTLCFHKRIQVIVDSLSSEDVF